MKKVRKITKSKWVSSSHHTVKTVMLARPKINTAYPTRYSPSLFFPSIDSSKYFKYLLEKIGDDFPKPLKGLHLLRGITCQNHFVPNHSLQASHVYRTNPQELQKLNEH